MTETQREELTRKIYMLEVALDDLEPTGHPIEVAMRGQLMELLTELKELNDD